MNINAKVQHIDYNKLLHRIQIPSKSKGPLANFFTKTVKVAVSPFVVRKLIQSPSILKRLIFSVAEEYGVTISELVIDSKVFSQGNSENNNFMKASILINSVNYETLTKFIVETIDSKTKVAHDVTFTEVLRIIKPFIGETIATIPLSAISELFELLIKDKIISLAINYGIAVSNIILEPSKVENQNNN